MVHNPSANNYSFLLFDEYLNTFTVKANLNQASFPASLSSLNSTQMANILLGQNCDLLRYNNEVFSISSQGLSSASGFTSPIQATSSDLQYLVSSNQLYSYLTASNTYASILQLNSHTNYYLKTWFNHIITWGATPTYNGTNGTYTVSQTVYIISNDNGASILKQIPITAYFNSLDNVQVFVSPELTKVHFEYRPSPSNTTISIMLYDIDFTSSTVYQLSMSNAAGYLSTTQNINSYTMTNYYLGDYFMVIRNGVSESTYQFMG